MESHCVMAGVGGVSVLEDRNVREKGRFPRNLYKILSVEEISLLANGEGGIGFLKSEVRVEATQAASQMLAANQD